MYKKYQKTIKALLKPFVKDFVILAFMLVVIAGLDALLPLATKYAIDNFVVPRTTEGIKTFAFVYFSLIAVFGTMIVLFIIKAGQIESDLAYHLRKEAFDRMQDYEFKYFDKEGVGKILSKITSDIQKLSDIISWGLVDLVWSISFMLFILVIMFVMNWRLALIVSIVVPILIVISYIFQKKIFHAQKDVRRLNSEIIRLINEGITGAITSKTLVTESKNTSEFKEVTDDMYNKSIKSAILSSIYTPLAINIGSFGVAGVLIAGGIYLENSWITLGVLVMFISYAGSFFDPIAQIARIVSDVQAAKAAAERVLEHMTQNKSLHVEDPVDTFEIIGNIAFDKVDFSYDEREIVLKDFSLSVKAGEKIALVGETGAGKSTIVNLICKFYGPTKGTMTLDGVDYSHMEKEFVQSNLGYVLQTPQLFSGSIMDNIRFGRLDASDEEVIEASKMAQCEEFIHKLEDGYETSVGEGGAKLSSGEKQLISIARAILADPKIFVLDEATSSIDVNTERKIQKAIETVLSGRTSFIIAHRLSTVKFVDRIILVDGGRIKEIGSHQELMSQKGHYYKLYMNQFA